MQFDPESKKGPKKDRRLILFAALKTDKSQTYVKKGGRDYKELDE